MKAAAILLLSLIFALRSQPSPKVPQNGVLDYLPTMGETFTKEKSILRKKFRAWSKAFILIILGVLALLPSERSQLLFR
jgi:hypothetical protein